MHLSNLPKRTRLLAILLVAAPLFGATSLRAVEGPIDLDRAIQIALERNADLQRQTNQVSLNQTTVDQARAQLYPDLNLSVSPSERFGRTFDPTIGTIENQRSESLSLRASSSLNLFNGFADQAAVESARLELNASQEDLERARQTVAYETASRFFTLFATEELIQVEEENIASQRQQLDRINAYWEQGTRARADVLQQEAALASAELRLVNAESSRDLAELRLKEILQINPLGEMEFTGPSLNDLTIERIDYRADQLFREALERRPDLKSQELHIAAAEEQIREANSGLLPKLNLSLGAGTGYSSLNQLSTFSNQLLDLNPDASIGLILSIPIFDRARTKSSVERAQVQVKNEQLALENLEQDIALAVQRALLDYQTALKRLEVTTTQQAAATEALAAMEARYDNGVATFVELSQSRAQQVDAAGSRIEAIYDVNLARLAVEFQRSSDIRQLSVSQ
jgi:outer membrane protein